MQDILTLLREMKRPRILMRSARIGAKNYKRSVHLTRLLGHNALTGSTQSILRLVDIEAGLNAQRLDGDASYDMLRHVDVLIAIVGEAANLQASRLSQ